MTDFQTALHQAAARQDHSQFCALIQHAVHGIDRLCTTQLQQVLHHPDFCALEARWRSLRHLTTLVTSPRRVVIRLLDLSWPLLARELNTAFDISVN